MRGNEYVKLMIQHYVKPHKGLKLSTPDGAFFFAPTEYCEKPGHALQRDVPKKKKKVSGHMKKVLRF